MTIPAQPAREPTGILSAEEISEGRQWIKDWRDGMFDSGSRDEWGWPIEMHGVVQEQERAYEVIDNLRVALARAEARLAEMERALNLIAGVGLSNEEMHAVARGALHSARVPGEEGKQP